jgi:hypothetical protein
LRDLVPGLHYNCFKLLLLLRSQRNSFCVLLGAVLGIALLANAPSH